MTVQMLENLWEACSSGDIQQVKKLTASDGSVDLNWKKPENCVSVYKYF